MENEFILAPAPVALRLLFLAINLMIVMEALIRSLIKMRVVGVTSQGYTSPTGNVDECFMVWSKLRALLLRVQRQF